MRNFCFSAGLHRYDAGGRSMRWRSRGHASRTADIDCVNQMLLIIVCKGYPHPVLISAINGGRIPLVIVHEQSLYGRPDAEGQRGTFKGHRTACFVAKLSLGQRDVAKGRRGSAPNGRLLLLGSY